MSIYNIFGKPEEKTMALTDVLAIADARPAPPLSATDRLQRNLERTVSESTARAEVLRQEIAAREAELADVLRAEEAARVGLEALDDRIEEGALDWPFGRPGDFSPITEDDLSAACGLALEAEMRGEPNGR